MKHLLAVLTVVSAFAVPAMGGGVSVRGGGDGAAIEFKNIGLDIVAKLKDRQMSFPLPLSDLENTLQTVKIQSVQGPLMLDRSRKDAINYPLENRVQLDLARWSMLSPSLKIQLVAHEVLGLLKIDDTDYLKSREIFRVVSEVPGQDRCSKVYEHQTASLACPAGQAISKVVFASYGLPSGTCGTYKTSLSCNSSASFSKIQNACLNKPSCSVFADNSVFEDPCVGDLKSLAIEVQCSDHWPDMVVTSIDMPSNPVAGSRINFSAVVKNKGTAPTPAGVLTGVAFFVDAVLVSWSDNYVNSIAPGESVKLTANGGPVSTTYNATVGSHEVMASVNDMSRYGESDFSNNKLTKRFQVAGH